MKFSFLYLIYISNIGFVFIIIMIVIFIVIIGCSHPSDSGSTRFFLLDGLFHRNEIEAVNMFEFFADLRLGGESEFLENFFRIRGGGYSQIEELIPVVLLANFNSNLEKLF